MKVSLESFDDSMKMIDFIREQGNKLRTEANEMERKLFRDYGIQYTESKLGNPHWQIDGSFNHFDTPREAIKYKEEMDKNKLTEELV